jgi:hypothetical protein
MIDIISCVKLYVRKCSSVFTFFIKIKNINFANTLEWQDIIPIPEGTDRFIVRSKINMLEKNID